jgi:hypothetical protein
MPPPPRAPLTTAERQAITNWIAAGGKFTDWWRCALLNKIFFQNITQMLAEQSLQS